MDNRGFTLSELIVTIALLGVVLAISFPAITKLQTQNQQQVYETYEKALLNAAKLYVDKYDRDLWKKPVTEETKCVIIKYEDLKYEDLIKEFDGMKKGETVDQDKTYVLATKEYDFVTKEYKSLTYKVSLVIQNGEAITHNAEKDPVGCDWYNIKDL